MSPEQARGAPVDGRSDLFSLAVVLYECIAGRRAFTGSSPMEICAQIIHDNPLLLSVLIPNIPSELDRVLFKALSKEPDSRYQSIGELLEDLRSMRDALNNENGKTKQIQPLQKTWIRRLLEQLGLVSLE
jgi:serine/threonine-protein kinase